MTRISGFEKIAADMQHLGLFLTMTAPSRMHKWRTVAGGRVVENPLYDGTTPKAAQAYHAKNWGRIRAALARRGVKLYGFRIAEPNHDGTPHWHLLVFVSPHWPGWTERDGVRRVCAIIRRYCLMDSGHERGAKKHRVDFKPIDAGKGSAAGYIAKYVAKNIDGYALERDLLGNDAITASHRVETWASTWGIRQFQQVGGAPVGPWRELRRVEAIPAGAPAHLVQAHAAVNRTTSADGEVKAASWAEYVKAQGGVYIGRAHRIKVSKAQDPDEKGRYGDPAAPRPVGVETVSIETYSPAWGLVATRTVHWVVESSRHVWEIVKRGAAKARGFIGGVFNGAQRPWTRVNNCTQEPHGNTINGAEFERREGHSGHFGMERGPGARESGSGGLCGSDDRSDPGHESRTAPAFA